MPCLWKSQTPPPPPEDLCNSQSLKDTVWEATDSFQTVIPTEDVIAVTGILNPHLINCVTLGESQSLQAFLSLAVKWDNSSYFQRVHVKIKDNVYEALDNV